MNFFGYSVLQMIKLRSLGWTLIQYYCVLIKNRNLDTEKHTQGERHVKMEAEFGVMHPQVKEG